MLVVAIWCNKHQSWSNQCERIQKEQWCHVTLSPYMDESCEWGTAIQFWSQSLLFMCHIYSKRAWGLINCSHCNACRLLLLCKILILWGIMRLCWIHLKFCNNIESGVHLFSKYVLCKLTYITSVKVSVSQFNLATEPILHLKKFAWNP